MSALVFTAFRTRARPNCELRCWQREKGSMARVARWRVSICGYPAGLVCGACKSRWEGWWADALGKAEEAEAA